MLDYYSVKVGYTAGNDFTLSGESYTGFYFTDNTDVYAGKNIDNKNAPLTVTNRFFSNIVLSDFFRDRLIDDISILPFNYDQHIAIHTNDLLSSRLINDRLQKLYNNTLYIYSQSFLASNDIPNGYNYAAGVDRISNKLQWVPQTEYSSITFNSLSTIGYSEMSDIIDGIGVKTKSDNYVFMGISPTNFSTISSASDFSDISIIKSTQYVDENTDLTYKSLTSISYDSNHIFLCDSATNLVYKYDVSGYIIDDKTIQNRKQLIKTIGGTGTGLARTKFSGPQKIFANKEIDRVFVHDSGNKCIKIYDFNLSYITTIFFTRKQTIAARAFGYNNINKYVYVFIENKTLGSNELWICDRNLKIKETYILKDILTSNEYIRGVVFSKTDSNIFYMYTNTGVYKKFITKPDKTIGKWLFYKGGANTTHIWNYETSKYNEASWFWNEGDASVAENTKVQSLFSFSYDADSREDIFVLAGTTSYNFNKILHYNERNVFNSVLGTSNLPVYNILEANVANDEMISGIAINKELYKTTFNILTLARQISKKYIAEYDYLNNLVYKGTEVLNEQEFSDISTSTDYNFLIHENEHASNPAVLNRCFKSIYDIQYKLINAIKTKKNNTLFSSTGSQTIDLT